MIRIEFTQPEIFGILYRMTVARVKLSFFKLEQRILDSFGEDGEDDESELEKGERKRASKL